MLSVLAIAGYRSLKELILPLGRLNIVTGANGSGKSNLYRSLRLLADIANGQVVPSLAREGGLASTLWAGPEVLGRAVRAGEFPVHGSARRERTSLKLGFAGEEYSYSIDLGLPVPNGSAFDRDPEIKRECFWLGPVLRPSALLADRRGPLLRVRSEDQSWNVYSDRISVFESMMTQLSDPRAAPEVLAVRESIRRWRFYDHFRTDEAAAARMPQVGSRTMVLANDGSDVAAAIQTIFEIGDAEDFASAIDGAFPGSRILVDHTGGRFTFCMEQHGLLRPLRAAELSDGTLRYVLWAAALLTPRPPALLIMNEPETSLHPDLFPALAKLIIGASQHSQVIVVSHAAKLVGALEERTGCRMLRLEKSFGETRLQGAEDLNAPQWHWPSR